MGLAEAVVGAAASSGVGPGNYGWSACGGWTRVEGDIQQSGSVVVQAIAHGHGRPA